MGDLNRKEIETLWRTRVQDAQLRLDFTRNFLEEIHRDSGPSTPDSKSRFEEARRSEHIAFADYCRILRLYTDLVLSGTIPDEDQWPLRKAAKGA